MRSAISFQQIPVLIDGHDTEGCLILHEGQLVAVLARLDGESHDEAAKGRWHLEAGFGPCQELGTHLFDTQDEAAAWASDRVGRRPTLHTVSGPPYSNGDPTT